jgi:hypothetical protein
MSKVRLSMLDVRDGVSSTVVLSGPRSKAAKGRLECNVTPEFWRSRQVCKTWSSCTGVMEGFTSEANMDISRLVRRLLLDRAVLV